MALNRAAKIADYQQKWDAMEITRGPAVEAAARRIVELMPRYQAVSAKTGVPAEFIAVLHMRESNNDFRGVLHNGEKIIGTGRKTRLVPRGRGPFSTWEEAAVDALTFDGLNNVKDWSPAVCLYEGECFNGLGYARKGRPSPYVLAGTQFYKSGKYVADGRYSASAVDRQLGIAPVMKRVLEIMGQSVPTGAVAGASAAQPVSFMGRMTARRAEVKSLATQSRLLRLNDRIKTWLERTFAGVSLSFATLEQVRDFLIDWRSLAVLVVMGGAYLYVRKNTQQTVAAHNEGRYKPSGSFAIPAADGESVA